MSRYIRAGREDTIYRIRSGQDFDPVKYSDVKEKP
jgi:hypothetical protein